jgi:hypothetical protein
MVLIIKLFSFSLAFIWFISIDAFASLNPNKKCIKTKSVEANYSQLYKTIKILNQRSLTLGKTCEVLNTQGLKPVTIDNYGKESDVMLSPFWAQEYTGADLAQLELKELNLNYKSKIMILDAGFEQKMMSNINSNWFNFDSYNAKNDFDDIEHGTIVANIISDPLIIGHSPTAQIVAAKDFNSMFYDKLIFTDIDFINISMGLSAKDPKKINQLVSKHKAITIISSGNNFPDKINPYKSQVQGSILVGSLDPHGEVSYFSQTGKEVDIVAPSDFYVMGKFNDFSIFGGTSGAAPQVTAALSNIKSLLPLLTSEQAKILLNKSAFPIYSSLVESPQVNGAGMLNSYKLFRVAKKLKRICYDSFTDEQSIQVCVNRNIKRRDLFRFYNTIVERDNLAKEIEFAFPQCFQRSDVVDSCYQKEILIKLRKSLLLEPDSSKLHKHLSCIHQFLGFSSNATFHKNMETLYAHNNKQYNLLKLSLNFEKLDDAKQLLSKNKSLYKYLYQDKNLDYNTLSFIVNSPELKKELPHYLLRNIIKRYNKRHLEIFIEQVDI